MTPPCRACQRPPGQGHGVRLYDITLRAFAVNNAATFTVLEVREDAIPLCARCRAWIIASVSRVEDTHLGQEEDADDA